MRYVPPLGDPSVMGDTENLSGGTFFAPAAAREGEIGTPFAPDCPGALRRGDFGLQ
jgi:hypothetical protein